MKLPPNRETVVAGRYFQISVPIEIAQRPGALIKVHPELGYRSVGEAGKHALANRTHELEALVAAEGSPRVCDEGIHEIVDMLQRHLAEKRQEKAIKKTR